MFATGAVGVWAKWLGQERCEFLNSVTLLLPLTYCNVVSKAYRCSLFIYCTKGISLKRWWPPCVAFCYAMSLANDSLPGSWTARAFGKPCARGWCARRGTEDRHGQAEWSLGMPRLIKACGFFIKHGCSNPKGPAECFFRLFLGMMIVMIVNYCITRVITIKVRVITINYSYDSYNH